MHYVKNYTSLSYIKSRYYPFGLVMNGISSKAAGSQTNRKKFNGKEEQREEFSDESGLELLDYGARMQDPQLGRWHNIDIKADNSHMFSPYNYTLNNPLKFIDPDGKDVDVAINKQQVQGQNQIKATATINLTIVDPTGNYGAANSQQLQKMVHNAYSGNIYTTTKDAKGRDVSTSINVDVQLNITIVKDVDKAKSTDYILTLVDNIPSQNTSEGYVDPIGLAKGDVGTVERMSSGEYVNTVATHELGHILGLSHTPGTIMNKTIDTDPKNNNKATNSAQVKQLWEWIKNLANGNNTDRMGTTADSRTEMKTFISNTQ